MKKILLSVTVSLLMGHQATAGLFAGLQLGVARNELISTLGNRPVLYYAPESGIALTLPLLYEWRLTDRWGITAGIEPGYVQKRYAVLRTDGLTQLSQHTHNNYVQSPVTIGTVLHMRRWQLSAQGGLFGGRWASSRISGGQPNMLHAGLAYPSTATYNEAYTFSTIRDNRTEYGWCYGGGLTYRAKPAWALAFRIQHYAGVTDLQKDYMIGQVPRYNSTTVYGLSVLVSLSAKDRADDRYFVKRQRPADTEEDSID
jgi:hypothetical protein